MGGRSVFAGIIRGASVELRQMKQPRFSPGGKFAKSILGLEPED